MAFSTAVVPVLDMTWRWRLVGEIDDEDEDDPQKEWYPKLVGQARAGASA